MHEHGCKNSEWIEFSRNKSVHINQGFTYIWIIAGDPKLAEKNEHI
jgi:hypothetical protein